MGIDEESKLAEERAAAETERRDSLEGEWADQLFSSSLVVQVDYDDADALNGLAEIGKFFRTKQTERILRDRPASFLVGLNCIASSKMQQGTLWPFIFEGLDLPSSQGLQEIISRLHRQALNKFRLERFEHPLGRIGEILLHAGIPVSSQEKFVRRLIREYRSNPDFDNLSFNEGIRAIAPDRVQAASLDKPIWHFINQAGNVADDFVARCVEILDEPDNPTAGEGLPARVIAEVSRLVNEIGRAGLRRAGSSVARVKAPYLRWDYSMDNQLEVVFPALPESQQSPVRWTIEAGGTIHTVDLAQELVGVSRQERSQELSAPVGQLTVQSESLDSYSSLQKRTWALSLFPDDQPVMFFDSEGKMNPGKGPLEPGLVRVLYPNRTIYSQNAPEIQVDGLHANRSVDAPLGWGSTDFETGWSSLEIDCSQAEAIEISFGGNSRPLRRAISAFRRPRVSNNGLVPGVFDQDDSPVFSEFPVFDLGTLSEDGESWTYQIRSESRTLLWSSSVSATQGRVKADPPSELSGTFVIQISRGFGQTTTVTRTVLPGLLSSYDGMTRQLKGDGTGLDSCLFELSGLNGFHEKVVLGPKERFKRLTIPGSNPIAVTARARYEFFELFNLRSKRHTEWIEPTKSHVENLTELQLFFSSEIARTAALIARWSSGESQVLQPRVSSPWFKFDLRELGDAANARGAFRLIIRDDTGRELQAGSCYPKKLFQEVEMGDDFSTLKFKFPGGVVPEGLQVAMFATGAPWVKPTIITISEPEIGIPEHLRSSGKLAITVAVSSPWAPHDFGSQPDMESSNTVEFTVLPPNPELSPEQALIHWFMTGQESQLLEEMEPSLAWACFTSASQAAMSRMSGAAKLRDLAGRILSRSQDAVALYPASSRTAAQTVSDMIESGVVATAPVVTGISVTEMVGRPSLVSAGIAIGDSERARELADVATSVWGAQNPGIDERDEPALLSVLSYKLNLLNFNDPKLPALIRSDDSFFAEVSAGYVPARLLDGGTVFLNVFKPLRDQTESMIAGLGVDWALEVTNSLAEVGTLVPIEISQLLEVRPLLNKDELKAIPGLRSRIANWPAISFRSALAARLAARGNVGAKTIFDRVRPFYLKMSIASPFLVEMDLAIAELALREIEVTK